MTRVKKLTTSGIVERDLRAGGCGASDGLDSGKTVDRGVEYAASRDGGPEDSVLRSAGPQSQRDRTVRVTSGCGSGWLTGPMAAAEWRMQRRRRRIRHNLGGDAFYLKCLK